LITYEKDDKYAIRVQNGNFFWGKEQKSDPEKVKENEEKINKSMSKNGKL
jgi:hypothetical protein